MNNPNPFLQQFNLNVYCSDNIAFMKTLPDNFFDFATCDIEYCIGASKPSKSSAKVKQKNGSTLNLKNQNYIASEWDFQKSNPEYFEQLFRISKNQIIFGGNYYGLSGGYLVWDKLNGKNDQYGCELAWLSFTKRTDIVYYMYSGMMQGKYIGKNVKKALIQNGNKSQNEKRIHATQKPVILYKYILETYVPKGSIIFDSHFGSGTHGIACYDYDYTLYACESDQVMYNKSIKKISEHIISNPKIKFPEF